MLYNVEGMYDSSTCLFAHIVLCLCQKAQSGKELKADLLKGLIGWNFCLELSCCIICHSLHLSFRRYFNYVLLTVIIVPFFILTLEKTFKIIRSNHQPELPNLIIKSHVPKHHIHTSLKYLQGQELHHFHEPPVQCLTTLLVKKFFLIFNLNLSQCNLRSLWNFLPTVPLSARITFINPIFYILHGNG